MKIKNIYWIVVDSMRHYKGKGDSRFRINYFDELEEDFFNFTKAYTSAPSTIMSAASMFTGVETIKIARNYSDWKFNIEQIKPLYHYLLDNNFTNFPIDNSKRAREMLKDLMGVLDYKSHDKYARHHSNWSNLECFQIFKNVINQHTKKCKYVLSWLDCRGDANIENIVKSHINFIKEKNQYEDSMIIINSDHGYPDPTAIKTANIIGNRHDLIVTEDNIKVPLLIKIPGLKSRTIDNQVSLMDIFPTILELLNTKTQNKIDGISLIDLLKNNDTSKFDNRIIRTDTRLLLQEGKITCLIKNNLKYVYYHDNNTSEIYNLKEDASELKNFSADKNYQEILNFFKGEYEKRDKEIFKEQENILQRNLKKSLKSVNFKKYKEILILSNINIMYINIILRFLKNNNDKFTFKIFRTKNFENKDKLNIFPLNSIEKLDNYKDKLILVIDEKNYYRILDDRFIVYSGKVKSKRIFLDLNFEKNNLFFSKWVFPLLKYKNNYEFYKKDPILFLKDFAKLFNLMVQQYIFKKKVSTPRMEDVKLQRDRLIQSRNEMITVSSGKYVDHTFFYNNLINWGGTQKTMFYLMRLFNKNNTPASIFTNSITLDFLKAYKLHDIDIQLLSGISKNIPNGIGSIFLSFFYRIFMFIFKRQHIVVGSFYHAFAQRKNFEKLIEKSKYFSTFLLKPNIIILIYINYFTKKDLSSKIILNERNDITVQYFKNTFLKKFYFFLLRKKKVKLVTNSLNTYKTFKSAKTNCELIYIYNKIDDIIEKNYDNYKLKPNLIKLSCVGRFTYQKGQIELIKIISSIKNKDYILNFYGRGLLKKQIEENVLRFRLVNKINLKSSNNLNDIYKDTDVVLINSVYEGQSNVLLECLEHGKPMLINKRLKDELIEIYGHEVVDFIYFFNTSEDINFYLEEIKNNSEYLKKILTKQKNFALNYKHKFHTIDQFYTSLK